MSASQLIGWSFAGTGLFAWWRRPANPVGALMFLTGFFWFFNVYQLSDTTWLFVAGFVLANVSYGFLIHLLLVFPDGKLRDPARAGGGRRRVPRGHRPAADRRVPDRSGAERLRRVPRQPAADHRRSRPLRHLRRGPVAVRDRRSWSGLVVALVRRWRAWSASAQDAVRAGALGRRGEPLADLAAARSSTCSASRTTLRQALFLASLIPFAFVPFAFLIGLLRSRISRAEAVGDLVAGLAGERRGPGPARRAGRRPVGPLGRARLLGPGDRRLRQRGRRAGGAARPRRDHGAGRR